MEAELLAAMRERRSGKEHFRGIRLATACLGQPQAGLRFALVLIFLDAIHQLKLTDAFMFWHTPVVKVRCAKRLQRCSALGRRLGSGRLPATSARIGTTARRLRRSSALGRRRGTAPPSAAGREER